MSLVVEDGSGIFGAESYVSVATCVAYADLRGLAFSDAPLYEAEAALRRATTWIDGQFGPRFSGRKRSGRSQSLQWPRVGAMDADGFPVADSEVPNEIVSATCEAAIRELMQPGALSPDVKTGEIITSASVDGAVSVEYAVGAGLDGQRTIATVVDDILAGLIGARVRPGSAYIGRQDRS